MATIKRIKHYVIFTVPGFAGYTVRNAKGEYENHVHLRTLKDCESVIRWVEKKVIPKSDKFRESCRRLSTDKTYHERLRNHRVKDYYYNPNKGVKNR